MKKKIVRKKKDWKKDMYLLLLCRSDSPFRLMCNTTNWKKAAADIIQGNGKKPNLMCANSSSRWIREVIRKIFIVARYLFLFEIIHLPISRHRRRCWCLNCEHIACTFEHDIIHCLRNGGRCKKKHAYELKMSTLSIGKKEPWDSDDNGRRSTYVPFARLLTHFCACWLRQHQLDPLQKIERVLFLAAAQKRSFVEGITYAYI